MDLIGVSPILAITRGRLRGTNTALAVARAFAVTGAPAPDVHTALRFCRSPSRHYCWRIGCYSSSLRSAGILPFQLLVLLLGAWRCLSGRSWNSFYAVAACLVSSFISLLQCRFHRQCVEGGPARRPPVFARSALEIGIYNMVLTKKSI